MINSNGFILFLFTYVVVVQTLTGQVFSNTDKELLYEEGANLCNLYNHKSFCKAFHFYKEEVFDSSYVYSGRALDKIISKDEEDILHYIQGVSANNLRLYKKALQNFKNISNTSSFRNLKNLKLGQSYLVLEVYDSAIYHYQKWEKSNANTDLVLKKNGYHNLGLSYIHKKEYSNATTYFRKELALIEKTDTLGIITTKAELANIYYNQYQDDIAIPLFEEVYKLASSFSDIESKQNASKNLGVVEKNRKNYEASLGYYLEYNKWRDSIVKRDRVLELIEHDKKLAVAQKQSEIVLKNEKINQQNKQRTYLIIGTSILVIFIGFLIYFYKKSITSNRLINLQKEELHQANTTKDYLFSVVSHDLRSPLITLQKQQRKIEDQLARGDFYELKKTSSIATAITQDTFHLLNNVLHWSLEQSDQLLFNTQDYPLQSIIEQVWVNFENVAISKDISFYSDIETKIMVRADKESLKIVLRNIFDNAIKYNTEKGEIVITTAMSSQDQCMISISNTGVGISNDQVVKINRLRDISIDKIDRSKGVGLGLLLCQTLIKKNKGKLIVESEFNKGTTITIALPSISDI